MPLLSASLPEGPGSRYRRYLIAAGTTQYERLDADAQLPSVALDVDVVSKLFAQRLGYECVLRHLADSPTSGQFRAEISDWLIDDDRQPNDLVVIYYSGHGAYGPDGRHYLLTRDSAERNLIGTAVATEDLVRMLGGTVIQHALIVIDTCYAGAGAYDLVAMLRSVSSSRLVEESAGSGLWFVAAARPKQEAHQHAFVPCLVHAIDNPRHGMANQRYLDPNSVVAAVNEELKSSWPHQHARAAMGDSSGISPLLPNPRYRPVLPTGLDLETQRSLLRQEDLLSHWGPRSRGVEVEGDKGWFFTGRRQALRELVSWLDDGDGDRIQVVTGGPGSGKSALLARLVTLADPGYRSQLPSDEAVDPGMMPPLESIDLAVVARDKTLADVISIVADAARVAASEPALLIASLGASPPSRLTIVIDSLDEAAAPKDIARRLLAPLAFARIPGVRVLVGTRRELLPALGSRTQVIDLDAPSYLEASDIADYAAKILNGVTDGTGHSPYRGNPRLARQVAEAVAARAYPTFLIARIVSRSLVDAEQPMDIGKRGWRTSFPATVGDALEQYLERFGADQQRVRDLIQPLAYAAGAGLPWEDLWAPLASALAGVRYSDSDVRWVLQQAGAYIIETTEEERSVYRLYHQALAEHLRDSTRGVDAHRRITRTLVAALPRRGSSLGPDWPKAHPYIRSYLAGHAAEADLLDELLIDPLYLAAASPRRLTEVLTAAREDSAVEVARTYQHCAHRLVSAKYADNAAILELTARCDGKTDLADEFTRLPLRQPWHTPWARWQAAQEYRLVGRHDMAVDAMAVTVFDDRPIVVSAGEDATVRCWDLEDGIPFGEPLVGHTSRVAAVAVGAAGGQTLIVSAGDDGTVRRWDLADGILVGPPMRGHEGRVNALAIAELTGRSLIVSAGDDGTVRRWDLADGILVGPPMRGHEGRVNALATGMVEGRCVIVSGGVDWNWRQWDARDGSPVGEPVTVHDAEVTTVALSSLGGHGIVLSGSVDTYVRCWDLVDAQRVGDPLMSHDGKVSVVFGATVHGESVVVSSGADKTIRRWSAVESATPGNDDVPHRAGISAVAAWQFGGQNVLITGGEDRVLCRWDVNSGQPVGPPIPAHEDWVNAIAAGTLSRRLVAASAGGDGTVRLWDVASGTAIYEPLAASGWVNTVDLTAVDGVPLCVAGGNDGLIYLWNLDTGQLRGKPLASGHGSVLAVAVIRLGDKDIVVSTGADGILRRWELPAGRPFGAPITADGAEVWCLASARIGGIPIAVTGDRNGTLRWRNLSDGQSLGESITAHGSAVLGVAMGQIDGHDLTFSVGGDGQLCIWQSPGILVNSIATGSGLLDLAFVPPRHVIVAGWRGMFLLTVSSTAALGQAGQGSQGLVRAPRKPHKSVHGD